MATPKKKAAKKKTGFDEDEKRGIYIIEPDQPIEVTEDPQSDEIKLQILLALQKKLPGKYFSEGLDLSQLSLDEAISETLSGKCVFEVVTIGTKTVKKLQGGAIRFFDTNPNEVAATLNTFVFNADTDEYAGDILNLLLEKSEQGLTILDIDYLVEARFFQPA